MHGVIKSFRLSFLISLILFTSQSFPQSIGEVNAGETHQTMEGFGAAIAWADKQLASSVYFFSLKAGSFFKTMKMILLK